MTTTDIKALVAKGRLTFEGVPRDRTAWELANALERTQAVVEAARLDDMAADGVTVAMVEIKALSDDLEAVAVAAREFTEGTGDGLVYFDKLRKALARPGVVAVLDQATSRAAATSGICSGKS